MPTIPVRDGNEDFNVKSMPSKCSIILIDQKTKSDIEAAAVLMARMSALPTAMILLADTPPQDVPRLAAPLLVLAPASPLVQ